MNREKYYSNKLYCLVCPETNEIRYIGITKRYLSERLYKHLNNNLNGKSKKVQWINYLKSKKLIPIIKLIRNLELNEDSVEAEKKEIAKYNNLLNSNDGGNKPPYMAGHNKKKFNERIYKELGTIPDYKLAIIYKTNKSTIAKLRRNLNIPSYAETSSNDGKFNGKGLHPRWKK
jgi:hypothetical protein